MTSTATRESNPFGFIGQDKIKVYATHKQVMYAIKLGSERGQDLTAELAVTDDNGKIVLNSEGACRPLISKRDASDLITALLATPKVVTPPAPGKSAPADVELEPGMFMLDNVIYKVQRAIHGSGKLYAKVLMVDDTVTPAEAWFEYAPGVVRKLTVEHKLTVEQAKAFGALYGTCCYCAITLTDENSIFNGYGRKCASNHGLPYEKAPTMPAPVLPAESPAPYDADDADDADRYYYYDDDPMGQDAS